MPTQVLAYYLVIRHTKYEDDVPALTWPCVCVTGRMTGVNSQDDAEHMYEQIATVLRDQITTGQLKPGARLPTQAMINEEYGVSRIVARRALDLLESEGLIDRVQGGGAFVRRYQP